jgi:hypothetical protein
MSAPVALLSFAVGSAYPGEALACGAPSVPRVESLRL